MDVVLNEFGEIVNFIEQDDPAVVGCVVLRHFAESVITLFSVLRRDVLLDVVAVHCLVYLLVKSMRR